MDEDQSATLISNNSASWVTFQPALNQNTEELLCSVAEKSIAEATTEQRSRYKQKHRVAGRKLLLLLSGLDKLDVLRSYLVPKNFLRYLSHQIYRNMYGALNTVKK